MSNIVADREGAQLFFRRAGPPPDFFSEMTISTLSSLFSPGLPICGLVAFLCAHPRFCLNSTLDCPFFWALVASSHSKMCLAIPFIKPSLRLSPIVPPAPSRSSFFLGEDPSLFPDPGDVGDGDLCSNRESRCRLFFREHFSPS